MQIQPHPALAHFVRHYLVLEERLAVNWHHRLFTDGNTGLVFNLGNASLHISNGTPSYHSAWLYGQINNYHDLSLSGDIKWIIVVFQPYGAHHFWGVPAEEWRDSFFPAHEMLGASINAVAARLLEEQQLSQQIRLIDTFLLRQLEKSMCPEAVVMQAVEEITKHDGTLPIEALLRTLSVNERTLERKFKLHTGLTPKQFSGITRLNASAKRVKKMRAVNTLTDIAYESGYFDQAHFIRDFRKYTGFTPHQYQREAHPLALNFLQL
ncbi:helix-turn-helix transcriptional regulator [Chitinophaga ginsengisoli]|uniref:Helix-turn-helix protein n=1 Tax=Chitinophaga ginsengisoli TaxID=363837 RepID=A0A2P8GI13_9BACT|nr:helix-turn-helix transcriptional regulator [Chitinophaga ginsengisoli]PSL33613.1 helix-turn-helix protein [Chitinophaga ginsengisoli]